MNIAFLTGKTGLIEQGKALSVYSNNIANINTVGYQALRPSFADCLYTQQRAPQEDWQTGHGAYVQNTDLMFSESSFTSSDNPLDFALPNEGFFAVMDEYGEVSYTRDGSFGLSNQGDGDWALVTGDGKFVLDYTKTPIAVPFNDDGTVDYNAVLKSIGVFEFANPYGIEAAGSNLYTETARSGAATANEALVKLQYTLINSNVDLANEMVKLIETQRAYQLSSKVVQTADELARIANNLR